MAVIDSGAHEIAEAVLRAVRDVVIVVLTIALLAGPIIGGGYLAHTMLKSDETNPVLVPETYLPPADKFINAVTADGKVLKGNQAASN